jgi:hypothetical protein
VIEFSNVALQDKQSDVSCDSRVSGSVDVLGDRDLVSPEASPDSVSKMLVLPWEFMALFNVGWTRYHRTCRCKS